MTDDRITHEVEADMMTDPRARVSELERQAAALAADEQRLTTLEEASRTQKDKEQADVDRLKGHSPLVLWLMLTGTLESRMDREVDESLQADAAYEAVVRELNAVRTRKQQVSAALEACRAALPADSLPSATPVITPSVPDPAPDQAPDPAHDPAHDPAALREEMARMNSLYNETRRVMQTGDKLTREITAARQSLKRAEDAISTAYIRNSRHALWEYELPAEAAAALEQAEYALYSIFSLLADYRAGLSSVVSMMPTGLPDVPPKGEVLKHINALSLCGDELPNPRRVRGIPMTGFSDPRGRLSELSGHMKFMQDRVLRPVRAAALARRDAARDTGNGDAGSGNTRQPGSAAY